MAMRDRLNQLQEVVERRTGQAIIPHERLDILEASDRERRALQKELDLLAYQALNYVGGAPQELKPIERRKLAQQSRVAWMKDPLAGAAVDLMNDFVFGRGIPRPKAADERVQEVIDEAWDDPDNQLVLTSYAAQLALGTDLSLQSNLFFLVFDDGEDGKIKLGMLDHDSVQGVVRDPENRLRILYYVAHETRVEWDYKADQPKTAMRPGRDQAKVVYYEHWQNVEDARANGAVEQPPMPDQPEVAIEHEPNPKATLAPADRVADGKVFHVAINKTVEMAFGHPTFDRLLRWYNAYNKFMDARVDIMEASASYVMKRKIKGTPGQLQKSATQALSRSGAVGASLDYPEAQAGPKAASILLENEEVTHEDFNINTNAPAAAQDAQMLRAQVSAGTRFPQSYYGDAANATLATATSLELPVLKTVENRQEIVEAVVRFLIDRVIERAVETGRIPEVLDEDERAELEGQKSENDPANPEGVFGQNGDTRVTSQSDQSGPPPLALVAAHEDAIADEEDTARDLSYEFSMPSPLKRMMADLLTGVMNIARTFDPNNTNMELSRVLLEVALRDGLELEDVPSLVEKIFPPGYEDPAIAAANAMQQQPPPGAAGMTDPQFGEFAPQQSFGMMGADGQQHSNGNPYGAPMRAQPPEKTGIKEAAATTQIPPAVRTALAHRRGQRPGMLDEIVLDTVRGPITTADGGNT